MVVHRRHFVDGGDRIRLEQPQAGSENAPRNKEGGHASLLWRGGPHGHVVQNFLSIFPFQYVVTNLEL